jgi:hypothetical protein
MNQVSVTLCDRDITPLLMSFLNSMAMHDIMQMTSMMKSRVVGLNLTGECNLASTIGVAAKFFVMSPT